MNPFSVTRRFLQRLIDHAPGPPKTWLRSIDMNRYAEDVKLAIDIYNDAWKDNWGFLPVLPREAEHMFAAIRPIAIPELVLFGELDGKTEAMVIWIPDVNEMIADLGGRLLPFGWIKLLWRIRKQRVKSGRIILAGLRAARRDTPIGRALISATFAKLFMTFLERGIENVEFSWILEDNEASKAISSRFGNSRLVKRYRIYEKDLASS